MVPPCLKKRSSPLTSLRMLLVADNAIAIKGGLSHRGLISSTTGSLEVLFLGWVQ